MSIIHNSKFIIQNLFFPVALFLLLLIADSTFSQTVGGAPVSSAGQIKKNLVKNKKTLADLKKKLKEEERQQRLTHVKEKNVLNRLQKVDQKLGSLQREKKVNEQDLVETRVRLSRLQGEMKNNQGELGESRQLLKQRLRALYRMSFRRPFLGGLLDSESFGDFARKLKFELTIAQSNEKLLSQTLFHEQRLEQDSSLWNNEEKHKQRILGVLGRQESNYSRERKKKTIFLVSIQRQKETNEQMIAETKQAAQELQEQVSLLLRKAAVAKRNQKVLASLGTGLMVKRGKYDWPVSGEILAFFGKQKDKTFNEVVDNSGVQIKAPMGTPFQAVAGGLVRYADWFKGYGKLVILDHGYGYYSLYAQASELNVSEGQNVVAGQVIGAVGDTGSLYGSSLYFEIRKNGVPQDPLRWLQHRK